MPSSPSYDVVIVGAGFSGVYLLHSLRKLGYSCRVYESGTDLGGVWHWNRYPGARVDSEGSIYQYSIPEAWQTWSFEEKFPAAQEIRDYFAHIDKTLDIKKDVEFSTTVTGAQFDKDESKKWRVETKDGRVTTCRFLLLCVGFASQRYEPSIPGLETFRGDVYHSSSWPKDGVDVRGKKLAVIGTGASGVQIIQDLAKKAESMVVFQRTPNIALPMQQKTFSQKDIEDLRARHSTLFETCKHTFGGYLDDAHPAKTFDIPAEEREAYYESLMQKGGFSFLLGAFSDFLTDAEANRDAYNYWAKRTRARITDPRKRDLLAPLEQPHPVAAKRCSLEHDYFEQFNRPNVDLVNLREPGQAIVSITPEGVKTGNGTVYAVDAIALATGFNSYTGSLTQIKGLKNTSGTTLAEEWGQDAGVKTYLGMTRKGYPNMFLAYAVHGPTALSNGPTSIELQARWIVDAIRKIDESGLSYIEPTAEAEDSWKAQINAIADMTLFPKADSWYMGANIPGKKREMLNWPGGLPMYEELSWKALEGWEGFVTA